MNSKNSATLYPNHVSAEWISTMEMEAQTIQGWKESLQVWKLEARLAGSSIPGEYPKLISEILPNTLMVTYCNLF